MSEELKNKLNDFTYNLFKNKPRNILRFARNVLEGRFIEAEHLLLDYPEIALEYAREFIGSRAWPEGEKIFINDPGHACYYATEVIGKRWIEAEAMIRNSDYAKSYARNFLPRGWPIQVKDPILMTEEVS